MTTMTTAASKKRPASLRRLYSVGPKLLIWLTILICFLGFLKLQSHYAVSKAPTLHIHDAYSGDASPKVAFLFLVRRNLPLDFLWHSFFKNGEKKNFSIYIHSEPGYAFNYSTTKSPFFHDRQLKNSVQVTWGEPNMIEAERLLLKAALDDPANQRFVLLSDSCVPLYNFSYIYNYLMSSPKSFVDSFLDATDERYNPNMAPEIPKHVWRKGSQWIALARRHAEVVVNDNSIFPVFKKFCRLMRRQSMDDLRNGGLEFLKQSFASLRDCIPDEHYVQTLLQLSGLEPELERRTLTYSLWNNSAGNGDTNSWHPVTFQYASASNQEIKKIKDIDHVYYASEDRTERCKINSKPVPCFLFARKFSTGAALRLRILGVVGLLRNTTRLLNKPTSNL